MNKLLAVVAVAALVLAGVALVAVVNKDGIKLGGITNFDEVDVTDGYRVDNTTIINGSGVHLGTLGVAGTDVTLGTCATATWNPGSVATNTLAAVTSTDIALSGAAVGDVCLAALTSATTTDAQLTCTITGAATGTIQLVNLGTGALDLATGTASVCYFN